MKCLYIKKAYLLFLWSVHKHFKLLFPWPGIQYFTCKQLATNDSLTSWPTLSKVVYSSCYITKWKYSSIHILKPNADECLKKKIIILLQFRFPCDSWAWKTTWHGFSFFFNGWASSFCSSWTWRENHQPWNKHKPSFSISAWTRKLYPIIVNWFHNVQVYSKTWIK